MVARVTTFRFTGFLIAALAICLVQAAPTQAQLNVITVDCTPFISPSPTSFGAGLTMGMALQLVDPGNVLFNVTEVTPAVFRAMPAANLATFDLIAVNNRRDRIDCDGTGLGLGTTWHSVVGVNNGGRVVLSSHDAPRFHVIIPPAATVMGSAGICPGCEPFGTVNLIRDAALWAGMGCKTGLLIFNDAWAFDQHPLGGKGWDNPELSFPLAWGISDVQEPSGIADGGYTDILAAFTGHPIYAGVTDARLAPNSISSFAANIGDNSYHSVFKTFNAGIFLATEVVINSGVVDVGAFGCCSFQPISIPDNLAITIMRPDDCVVQTEQKSWGSLKSIYR